MNTIKLSKLLFAAFTFIVFTCLLVSCGKEEPIDTKPDVVINIEGKVMDQAANSFPGITLVLTASGFIMRATTNDMGIYTFSDIPDGQYKLEALKPWGGDITQSVKDVTVGATKATSNFTVEMKNLDALAAFYHGDKFGEIKDIQGLNPASPNVQIYAKTLWTAPSTLTQIKDQKGKNLTGADWQKISVKCKAYCSEGKTFFPLEMTGLVADGLYTIWFMELTEHHDINAGFARSIIKSVVPLKSGASHSFKASSTGTYSFKGETSTCVLTALVNGFAVFGSYEMDNKVEQTKAEREMMANDLNDATHFFLFY